MEDFDWLAGLSGLIFGVLVSSVVMYINYRIGKKQRRFDERYEQIHNKARSISWGVTCIAIILGWGAVIIVEGPGFAFFIMTGIYVIAMFSYIVGAAFASKKY